MSVRRAIAHTASESKTALKQALVFCFASLPYIAVWGYYLVFIYTDRSFSIEPAVALTAGFVLTIAWMWVVGVPLKHGLEREGYL